jgi:arylformamidase
MSSDAGWIDASVPLSADLPHWPSEPGVVRERIKSIAAGDGSNVSKLSLGVHSGTHVDAPVHFLEGEAPIDQMPLALMSGHARVVEIDDPSVIDPGELARHGIERSERVLFKSRNSASRWYDEPFHEDFVGVSHEGAEELVRLGVSLVGVDYLSVGRYHKDGRQVHRTLLGAGVWIVEGLYLGQLEAGRYEMLCLPIRLVGSDGAPARVLLRPVTAHDEG